VHNYILTQLLLQIIRKHCPYILYNCILLFIFKNGLLNKYTFLTIECPSLTFWTINHVIIISNFLYRIDC